jgi:hypothetical protein
MFVLLLEYPAFITKKSWCKSGIDPDENISGEKWY